MNKKITNKMLTKRKVNKFANGELLEKMNTSSRNVATKAFSGSNLGGSPCVSFLNINHNIALISSLKFIADNICNTNKK